MQTQLLFARCTQFHNILCWHQVCNVATITPPGFGLPGHHIAAGSKVESYCRPDLAGDHEATRNKRSSQLNSLSPGYGRSSVKILDRIRTAFRMLANFSE